ncbi:MAG: nitronate monooxygenase [Saprospiraceae bacterium]|jgi:nitronate monooxygenase|nr:nitronate monooxygenase [Saprospiraceae bacterium]MBP9209713.1 nitronate monooxygenase [Saprospiraceae bacterium]MBV6474112.1 Nitronate monooxygenase [Saprospiraceae bacterium]
MQGSLCALLGIRHPVIMAPMFLVSNLEMSFAAVRSGIAACIPALNYRTTDELRVALARIRESGACVGINLVANASNYKLEAQLKACVDQRVPFVISSLGNPRKIIDACKPHGIKVFCDVIDHQTAAKTVRLGPDGLIAVTRLAGGHRGPLMPEEFIPGLVDAFPDMPIIAAGGVGDRESYQRLMQLGAAGVSVGTVFIASIESPVREEYKRACVEYSDSDIVDTTKLSGVPCTVINTPYVQKTGTRQNLLQRLLHRNRRFKKWIKLLTYQRGMRILERAAFDQNYQTVWCAGPAIRYVHSIRPVKDIVGDIVGD